MFYEMANTYLKNNLEKLSALRTRLQVDVTQMAEHSLNQDTTSSTPTDMEELSSGNADQELTLSLLGNENDALKQIEAAIERINGGSYGRCEVCGRKISKARLKALPDAADCVRCASRREAGGNGRVNKPR